MMRIHVWKRLVAGFMVLVMAFILPSVHVNAAEKKGMIYIKDFKLYIDKNKEPAEAKDWFEKNGYTMIEGNLNADASGTLKREVGVYLGYATTTDPKEAVTDLAVMNERGNYSEGEYKRILEEQKKMYTDMVSDMKTMLEEYRANVNNGVPTAIQARDLMNTYKEDDSGELLGNLLMTIRDEALGTLLMQANGQVVLMIQERLASACDIAKTNWLDRMVKIGSYKKLKNQALKACNNDINKANKTLDKKYKEVAGILAENWEDIRQHITSIYEKAKEWDIENKSEAELDAFAKDNADNNELANFMNEYSIFSSLALYPYEGESLVQFFDQPAETFRGNGIRKLYPMAAALSAGQVSAIDQSVSLFTLIMDALNAGVMGDDPAGETKKILDATSKEDKNEMKEIREETETAIRKLGEIEPVSIYAGVDRTVFDGGGIAVTSTAKNFNNGDGSSWVDTLVNSKAYWGVTIGVGLAGAACMYGALAAARAFIKTFAATGREYFTQYYLAPHAKGFYKKSWEVGFDKAHKYYTISIKENGQRIGLNYDYTQQFEDQVFDTREYIYKKAFTDKRTAKRVAQLNLYKKMAIGLTIAGILLAVGDIVMTSITLYNYYNRDHLPIPFYMVDLSYDKEGQTSFINYKSVRDQKNDFGDVNGGGGKQWLALYQTHDEDAGAPILAPENGEGDEFGEDDAYRVVVQYGNADEPQYVGYAPLHLFGSPNTPQNLTYADGESGWSYNDGKKGTYVFFRHEEGNAKNDVTDEDAQDKKASGAESDADSGKGTAVSGSAADIGTAAGTGTIVLIGAASAVAGVVIGCILGTIRRRKDKTSEAE